MPQIVGIVVFGSVLTCLLMAAAATPDLATRLRARLRALLDQHDYTQTELATALHLSRSSISLILKSPRALQATMTLDRLQMTAEFFDVTVNELLLGPGETLHTLAPPERDLLELYRLLPKDQQGNFLSFLHFTFAPRREVIAERNALKMLRESMERQLAEPPTRRVR